MRATATAGSPACAVSSVDEAPALEHLGLSPGEPIRWRRQAGAHWNHGTVIRRETDGSVAVRDRDGAWRSIPVERLEARGVTRRGTRRWQPVAERADGIPQLKLW